MACGPAEFEFSSGILPIKPIGEGQIVRSDS